MTPYCLIANPWALAALGLDCPESTAKCGTPCRLPADGRCLCPVEYMAHAPLRRPARTKAHKAWATKYRALRLEHGVLASLRAMSGLSFEGWTFTLRPAFDRLYVQALAPGGLCHETHVYYVSGTPRGIPLNALLAAAEGIMAQTTVSKLYA